METLKKFVKYYAPYKGVFFLDLLCAAIISFVDLAFPQILRSLTKTLFLKDERFYFKDIIGCRNFRIENPDAHDWRMTLSTGTGYS